MHSILYLASGQYNSSFDNLPCKKIYCVDYNPNLKSSYCSSSKKVKFINKDALLAIDQLNNKSVMIDCLVVINEGLFEGGGNYPMFADFLMGYLYPLLKHEFTLITDLTPYQTSRYKALSKLDWAVEKVEEIFPGDSNYINPFIFTTDFTKKKHTFGQVFKMRKVDCETVFLTRNNQITVKLIHGSIWSDANYIDYIGLKLSNDSLRLCGSGMRNIKTSSELFATKRNVHNIFNKSFNEIVQDAESKNTKVLGLTPWGENNYEYILNLLENHQGTQLEEVRFYHINKNDFVGIYKSYADLIIGKYPDFFSVIVQSDTYKSLYLSVIKRGFGSLIQKLCEEITKALTADEDFCFSIVKMDCDELCVQSKSKNQFIQGLLKMVIK